MKKIILFLVIFLLIIYALKDKIHTTKTIVLGASLPKTGIIKEWGISVNAGANAYFKYANEMALLKDKKIVFKTYDDKYEPELTIKNINKLINEDNAFALFGFVGTPTVKRIMPIISDTNIPFIAPFTGASFLREVKEKNFINFRSSYFEEVEKLVAYLHDKKNLKKFAVFYQNDNYGEEGYIALLHSLKKRNLTLAAEGTYKRNTLSIRHAFQEIKDAKPQAIIMIGAYKANALFIKKAKEDYNFKDTIFCNISFGDANAMLKELDNTENLMFSQVVPSYMDTNLPVIKEYHQLMTRYYPGIPYGFISLEAFLAAKSVVYALQGISGDITQNKFLFKLKNIPPNTLRGLNINYKNSQLLNQVYLFDYSGGEFVEIKESEK
mgnify:CR=1 FL=1